MSDRQRKASSLTGGYISAKMANDLSPRKTMVVLVIVVGCFAVLWPKVFYPMLLGSANRHIKPSPMDRTKGCCDVISETDLHTLKIMSHICSTIIKPEEPLDPRALIAKCRSRVLDICGIDLSAVLLEQVQLGQTSRQILDQVRSLNGSLCLKYNFGVAPWSLGVPHRVAVRVVSSSVKQERPLHLRSEMVHPAFRERGRAIPQSQPQEKPAPPSRLIPKVIVPGRPGPVPGMRPTIGGAGHVVPAPKQGAGSMGLIMPIYTIGIIIFFTYTVMKVLFKKQPDSLYPSVDADATFRREVFESAKVHLRPRTEKDGVSTKLVVNAMSALLDEVDQELSARHKASEVTDQDVVANGRIVTREEDHASVKVLGMETTASCEGGKKWSRPDSPVLPAHPQSADPIEPPQEIFLEGSLPPQSHLLVTDSATEAQNVNSEEDPAVVLAGKMTLSVISLDSSDNLTDESSNGGKNGERSSSNTSEDFEKIEADCQLAQIDDAIEEAQNIGVKQSLLDEIRDETNQNKGNANMEIIGVVEDSEKGNREAQLKENYSEPELPITEDELKLEGEIEEESEQKMEEIKELTLNQDTLETNVEETTEKSTINEEKSVEAESKEQELAQSTPVELKETVTEEKISTDINEESSPDILVDLHPSEKTVEENINLDQEAREANGGATISESEEEVEEEEEEEEIEYEYEESDDEVDEEIRNVERMDEQDERPSQRMNGGDFDHSKNGTISDANMAENDISDDENSDDEDVIEEIIEYVTDEEDADLIENSVNHVIDN